MPIHEYACRRCGHQFEFLLLPTHTTEPACPECQSQELEKLLSGFALSSAEITEARRMKKRKAVAQNKNVRDQQVAESEHIREHVKEYVESLPAVEKKRDKRSKG